MGVIIRQGVVSGIILYAGAALGFVISVLLFPKTLGTEVYGFSQWLVFTAYTLAMVSLFGLNSVTIKYFPYFRDDTDSQKRFLSLILSLSTIILILLTLAALLFEPLIVQLFSDKRSEAFVSHYYYLIPLMVVIVTYFELLKSFASALFRPRFPIFLAEVVSRLLTLILIGLFYWGWIDTDVFIKLFALKNGINVLILAVFLRSLGALRISRQGWRIFRRPIFREMMNFSLFTIFSQIGNRIITTIDILMVSPLLGFQLGGIYTVFMLIASVITMPHMGISSITSPLIAQAMKDQDLVKVRQIYRQTAINNTILAILLFVGIWANIDNAITMLGPEYEAGRTAAILLCFGQLIHVMNGYNGYIIIHSPHYRFDLILKLSTCVITATSNYFFIQWYGLAGAALATAATLTLVNLASLSFIYSKFGFHPFSINTLKALVIGGISLAAGFWLPDSFPNFVVDIIVRSGLITVIYGSLTLGWKVSGDINNFAADRILKYTGKDPTFLRVD
ncbi:MAG: oligosaccharide flippase family protein [Lewinellaceae bacterium]|nr:oligosaccharide flippase family protein [Lewinellaceae bacterium]